VIEIDLALPLASYRLAVRATLGPGVTAVMGPSGGGKTSLLEAIAGLRAGTTGRLALDGTTLFDSARGVRTPPERRRIGYVPQDAGLFPHLTAGANVRFGARADGTRLEAAIEALRIRPLLGRRPATLSGGERQRVALARALATAPALLLLDEPLGALDIDLRERILPYLLRIRSEWRVPIVYVTHQVGEAIALADQVLLLREGTVAAHGAPLDLLATEGLRREAAAGIENLLPGRIVRHDPEAGVTRVELAGGLPLTAPHTPAQPEGAAVTAAIRAEEVLVALTAVSGLSARNVFEAEVAALERTGASVMLRCRVAPTDAAWLVRLTPHAVAALGLAPGARVHLAIKSHSVRLIG
jgi:molybdate transport system ATP-binding protein